MVEKAPFMDDSLLSHYQLKSNGAFLVHRDPEKIKEILLEGGVSLRTG
jgi:hypothetical protein